MVITTGVGLLGVEARDIDKYLATHKNSPLTTKNYPVQNVSNAEVEKSLGSRVSLGKGKTHWDLFFLCLPQFT